MSPTEIKCSICHKTFPEDQAIPGYGIEKEIEELILKEDPGWNDQSYICEDDLYRLRKIYIQRLVSEEQGQIEQIDQEVINSIHESELLSRNSNEEYAEKISVGNKVADKVAQFGGSWKFIISFFCILLFWIIINAIVLSNRSFDPYPFILLNLILSCLAAIQAPIIMMSQNRQEAKDRIRSENDYKVNLKAEIEIRTLHEKIDHLLLEQWSRMMKIQNIQVEMMEEIIKEMKKKQ
jgi:uncharacterized membrane protein